MWLKTKMNLNITFQIPKNVIISQHYSATVKEKRSCLLILYSLMRFVKLRTNKHKISGLCTHVHWIQIHWVWVWLGNVHCDSRRERNNNYIYKYQNSTYSDTVIHKCVCCYIGAIYLWYSQHQGQRDQYHRNSWRK